MMRWGRAALRPCMSWPRTFAVAAATSATLLLMSCGGGGGGDSAGGAGGGGSGGPVATDLVPAAPALANTLLADAASLRVLRPGATWRYTGVVRNDAVPARAYASVVTHAAAAGGAITEAADNALGGGPDSQVVRIEAGAVKVPLSLADLGVSRSIDLVELRSPVRVGDQIVQFNERVADAVADVDGDGKREALDLAIWTRVIGEEVIDLLHRPAVRTVRVDTTFAVRLRPSGANSPLGAVVTLYQRNWYLQGVGLVRTESDVPAAAAGGRDRVVEELESWDGVTEGLGAMPPVVGQLTANDAFFLAPVAAVAFADYALLMTAPDNSNPRVWRLVSVSPRGVVSGVQPISVADALLEPQGSPGLLLRVGDGLRLISRVAGANPGVVMWSLDVNGRPTGAAPRRLIEALPTAAGAGNLPFIAAAGTPGQVWLAWARTAENGTPNASFRVDLVVQGWAVDGTPIAPPRVLVADTSFRDVIDYGLAANSSQVLVTWATSTAPVAHAYAVLDTATGVERARKTTDAVPPFRVGSVPLALEGLLALSWGGSDGGAVRLDANFNAVATTPGRWEGDVVAPASLTPNLGVYINTIGGSLLVQSSQSVWREPLYGNTLSTLGLLTLTPGAGPIASWSGQLAARVPVGDGRPSISGLLSVNDFLLLYGVNNAGQLVTVPVWRAK